MSRRVALCIGVADYKGDLRLRNAVNDATDVHNSLRRLGYDTALCTNPRDMDAVNAHLDAFACKLRDATGLLFFAGHGTQNSAKDTYLLTLKDITHEHHLDNYALSLNKVLNMMRDGGAACVIVLLDACRTNAPRFGWLTAGGGNGAARDAGAARGMTVTAAASHPVLTARGSVIAWACGDGQVAFDGAPSSRNGAFTKRLLQHMVAGQTVDAIMERVVQGVYEDTAGAQVPAKKTNVVGGPLMLAPNASKRLHSMPSMRPYGGSGGGSGGSSGGISGAVGAAVKLAAKLAIGGALVFGAVRAAQAVAAAREGNAALTLEQRVYKQHLAREVAAETRRLAAEEARKQVAARAKQQAEEAARAAVTEAKAAADAKVVARRLAEEAAAAMQAQRNRERSASQSAAARKLSDAQARADEERAAAARKQADEQARAEQARAAAAAAAAMAAEKQRAREAASAAAAERKSAEAASKANRERAAAAAAAAAVAERKRATEAAAAATVAAVAERKSAADAALAAATAAAATATAAAAAEKDAQARKVAATAEMAARERAAKTVAQQASAAEQNLQRLQGVSASAAQLVAKAAARQRDADAATSAAAVEVKHKAAARESQAGVVAAAIATAKMAAVAAAKASQGRREAQQQADAARIAAGLAVGTRSLSRVPLFIQGAASVAFIVFDLANLPQDGLDSALHLISDVHALLLCKSTLACGDDATQQTINWLVTPALLVLQLADCNPFQWEGYGQADKALYATCVLTAAASAAGVLAAAVAVCQHPRSLGQLLGWTQPVAWQWTLAQSAVAGAWASFDRNRKISASTVSWGSYPFIADYGVRMLVTSALMSRGSQATASEAGLLCRRMSLVSSMITAADDGLNVLSASFFIASLVKPTELSALPSGLGATLGAARRLPAQAFGSLTELFVGDGGKTFSASFAAAFLCYARLRDVERRKVMQAAEDKRLDRLRLFAAEERIEAQQQANVPPIVALLRKRAGTRCVLRVPQPDEVVRGVRVILASGAPSKGGIVAGDLGTIDEAGSSNPYVLWDGKSRQYFDTEHLRVISVSRQLTAEEAKLRRVRVMVKPGASSKDDVRPGDVGAIDEEGSSAPWVKFDGKSSRPYYRYDELVWWGVVQRLDLVAPQGARKGMRVIMLPGMSRGSVVPGDIGTAEDSESNVAVAMWDAKPVATSRVCVYAQEVAWSGFA